MAAAKLSCKVSYSTLSMHQNTNFGVEGGWGFVYKSHITYSLNGNTLDCLFAFCLLTNVDAYYCSSHDKCRCVSETPHALTEHFILVVWLASKSKAIHLTSLHSPFSLLLLFICFYMLPSLHYVQLTCSLSDHFKSKILHQLFFNLNSDNLFIST